MRTLLSRFARPTAFLALALVIGLAPRPARADSVGAWQSISGPQQNDGAMAYDYSQHRVFTFGGDGTMVVRVVSLDGYPYSWTPFAVAGTPPAARSGCAFVYDDAHHQLVLFGGSTPTSQSLADVWTLNLVGTPTWTHVNTLGPAPDPRSDFGACWDPGSGELFVQGGLDSTGSPETNDLYALDLGAIPPRWSMPTQSGTPPTGRYGAPLTVDHAGNRLLVFGGNDGNDVLADAYACDLTTFTWSPLPMTGIVPEARSYHVCAWDSDDNQLVVWGGTASDDSVRVLDEATHQWSSLNWFIGPPAYNWPSVGIYDWQWNRLVVLAGRRGADLYTFFRVDPTNFWYGTGPTTFPVAASFVLDRANARAICYGGLDASNSSTISDFWQFAFTAPIGWNGVNTGGLDHPPRFAHVGIWDQARARMVVTLGNDGSGDVNNTWTLADSADFMNWYPLATAGTPPSPRTFSCGAYDPVGDRMLVFGGVDYTNLRADLCQLTLGATPTWTNVVTTGGPTGRTGASMIYDEPRRRMIVFGGADSVTGNYMNDVWALALPGLTWTHLLPSGTAPIGRWKHVAVYDSRRGRMLVFGGRETTGDSADVWQLNLVPATPVWTRLAPSGVGPLFRSEACAVYDSTADRMLVRGGVSLITWNTAIGMDDTWALQFSGGTVSVTPSVGPAINMVGEPWPNPAHGPTRLAYALARPSVVRAEVFDLAGRRVLKLVDGLQSVGSHQLEWSGLDDGGRPAPAGLYFVRVAFDGHVQSRKVVIAR